MSKLVRVCGDITVPGIRDGPGKRKNERSGPNEQTSKSDKVKAGHGGSEHSAHRTEVVFSSLRRWARGCVWPKARPIETNQGTSRKSLILLS